MYCQVSLGIDIFQDICRIKHGKNKVLSDNIGIVRYRHVLQELKKHPDDLVSNSDFPVLRCLGIRSSVSGIR
jgi:hypothetical protein